MKSLWYKADFFRGSKGKEDGEEDTNVGFIQMREEKEEGIKSVLEKREKLLTDFFS